jgi:hypothetical protein
MVRRWPWGCVRADRRWLALALKAEIRGTSIGGGFWARKSPLGVA